MRILHLLPGLKVGGQETMIVNVANEQVKTDDVIVMIINDDYDVHLLSLFDKRVEIVLIGRPRSSKNPLWLLKLNYEIWKLHPYVVHSHYEKTVMYLLKYGYKFVYTIHGFTIPPKYLRKNRNLIAISKGIEEDVKRRADMESTVIYNGLKTESIRERKTITAYNYNEPFRIVQVGRLYHEIKGQDILIKAIAKLRDKGYSNIQLDFIGDGPSMSYLQDLVKEYQLANVGFYGTKAIEYIYEHLHDYSLLVQPSRHEGFGLTVAEAMVAKIPVVVSDCSGLLEVVDNGRYSLVFKKDDINDCVEKITEIMNTETMALQRRVNAASEYVNNSFSVKMTARNYIDFYRNVR